MKKTFLTFVLTTISLLTFAQAPRVQIIHNSPDAAADTVDIWVNGVKAVDNLAFREATPFVTLASGTVNVGIAGKNSTVISDTIANFTFNLMNNTTYIAVADGTLSGSPTYNPFQAFNINVYAMGREAATVSTNVDILVHHGSTDAPTVDVVGQDPSTILVNDAPYGAFSNYLSLPEDDYIVRITDAAGTTIVQSYQAPLAGLNLAGQAITVVASGFLNPANNSNGPAFGLWVALASGGQLVELPLAAAPRVQVIHNSADAAAGTVDLWINGVKAVEDLSFREATPFVTLNPGLNSVGVAPGNSTTISDTIANFNFDLLAGSTYIAIAEGIVSASGYSPNTPFGISVYDMAREVGANANEVDVLVHHGATDAPTVDVRAVDTVSVLVDDISFGEYQGYLSLPLQDYVIRITDASGSTVVQSYQAPLATLNLGGAALTVVASGFLNPANNSNGPAFGLWVASAVGGALIELPVAITSSIISESQNFGELNVFPNPVKNTLNLGFDLSVDSDIQIEWFNINGQIVKSENLGILNAGSHVINSNIENLNSGWYLIKIKDSKGYKTIKVQVQQ